MIRRLIVTLFVAAPLLTSSARAETIYLILKSDGYGGATNDVALLKVPMETIEQCEEEGAKIVTSKRFDTDGAKRDAFECIRGK
jgi:hypothetical protein